MVFLSQERYVELLSKKNVSFLRRLAKHINANTRIEGIGQKGKNELINEIIKLTNYDFDNDKFSFRGIQNEFSGGAEYTLNIVRAQDFKKQPKTPRAPSTKSEIIIEGRETKNFKLGEKNLLPSGRRTEHYQYFKKAWDKVDDGFNYNLIRPASDKRTIGTQTAPKKILKSSGTQTAPKKILKSSGTQTSQKKILKSSGTQTLKPAETGILKSVGNKKPTKILKSTDKKKSTKILKSTDKKKSGLISTTKKKKKKPGMNYIA